MIFGIFHYLRLDVVTIKELPGFSVDLVNLNAV